MYPYWVSTHYTSVKIWFQKISVILGKKRKVRKSKKKSAHASIPPLIALDNSNRRSPNSSSALFQTTAPSSLSSPHLPQFFFVDNSRSLQRFSSHPGHRCLSPTRALGYFPHRRSPLLFNPGTQQPSSSTFSAGARSSSRPRPLLTPSAPSPSRRPAGRRSLTVVRSFPALHGRVWPVAPTHFLGPARYFSTRPWCRPLISRPSQCSSLDEPPWLELPPTRPIFHGALPYSIFPGSDLFTARSNLPLHGVGSMLPPSRASSLLPWTCLAMLL
jgi:hypothetical protein